MEERIKKKENIFSNIKRLTNKYNYQTNYSSILKTEPARKKLFTTIDAKNPIE